MAVVYLNVHALKRVEIDSILLHNYSEAYFVSIMYNILLHMHQLLV